MSNTLDPAKFIDACCREAFAKGDKSWKTVRKIIDQKLQELDDDDRQSIVLQLTMMVSREEDQTSNPVLH
jgi:hypothetical protein